jgi:Concanavalin A-like lectin/glucanases superfamily/Glucose / Sorbosone dehydrogenase
VSRFTLGTDNTVGPETPILGTRVSGPCPAPANTVEAIPVDHSEHTIGTVRSAPDGTLWIGSGDGANSAIVDPKALRTYNEQSLSGKIMHVDRNGLGLGSHPFCSSDTDLTHVCTKLFAKGLRNPYRFTLRPGGGGLALGDVGWNTYEEFELVPPVGGANYVGGAEVASKPFTKAIPTSTGPLKIGGDALWGEFFSGRIDELRVYDHALTVAEIQADMNRAVG